VCKKDNQKLLGKINYLLRFVSNLAGQVESLLPLVRLKHEEEYTWGAEQREAFEKIKIPRVSTSVASSEGRKPIQDVYCCTRMGYWSCSTTRRSWQGVSGGIRESTST
jgi:hypothetical protein